MLQLFAFVTDFFFCLADSNFENKQELYQKLTGKLAPNKEAGTAVRASSFLRNSVRTLKGAVSKKDDSSEVLRLRALLDEHL